MPVASLVSSSFLGVVARHSASLQRFPSIFDRVIAAMATVMSRSSSSSSSSNNNFRDPICSALARILDSVATHRRHDLPHRRRSRRATPSANCGEYATVIAAMDEYWDAAATTVRHSKAHSHQCRSVNNPGPDEICLNLGLGSAPSPAATLAAPHLATVISIRLQSQQPRLGHYTLLRKDQAVVATLYATTEILGWL